MINNGELVFIKSVKDGIPNRDPLQDSDARRIFPEEDGRISISDVSVKRDIRDYVADMYPQESEDNRNYIYVQEKINDKGKLLGRGSLASEIAKFAGKEKEAKKEMKQILLDHCFDVRTFGIVYSVTPKFNLTGPVQFGWGHSMHPVDTQYVQGTVVMPSKDIDDDKADEGKTQGTIWTSYTLPFAVFKVPAVINAKNAEHVNMTVEDQELLLKALWQGTQHRQARGRGNQQPLLLVHVEYNDPFFRIGYLEDYVTLKPERDQWLADAVRPSSVQDIEIDVTGLLEVLQQYQSKIKRCRIWKLPSLGVTGDISKYEQPLW